MSRQIGLKEFTICKITTAADGAITYGEAKVLERAVSAKITPKTSSDKVYSDDALEEIIATFDSIDVEIEVNNLSIESRAELQGAKMAHGVIVESTEDVAPEIALGFKSKKSNGEYRYIWLLKGKFELTEDQYETVADKPKVQSGTLKGTFGPNKDGQFRIMADSDAKVETADKTKLDALITGWFNGVPTIAADGSVTAATKTPRTIIEDK